MKTTFGSRLGVIHVQCRGNHVYLAARGWFRYRRYGEIFCLALLIFGE